ncbi:MAG: hypothetical protein FH748_16755 [Balneolaceae bacterium]|nr:hypothetical protein [Balneolaceae bacterium]
MRILILKKAGFSYLEQLLTCYAQNPGDEKMKTIKTNVAHISNTSNLTKIWLFRGLSIAGVLFGTYQLLQMFFSEQTVSNTEFLLLSIVTLLFIAATIKTYRYFSGIRVLVFTDYGIYSNWDRASWESITDIYLEKKLGIPILYVEFLKDDERDTLKTAVTHIEGEKEQAFNQVQSKWSGHKDS